MAKALKISIHLLSLIHSPPTTPPHLTQELQSLQNVFSASRLEGLKERGSETASPMPRSGSAAEVSTFTCHSVILHSVIQSLTTTVEQDITTVPVKCLTLIHNNMIIMSLLKLLGPDRRGEVSLYEIMLT